MLLRPGLHVVLVHPQVHVNTGSIARTCVGFGAHLHLVRPLGFLLSSNKMKRAGLTYWDQLQQTVWDSWQDVKPFLRSLDEVAYLTTQGEQQLHQHRFSQCSSSSSSSSHPAPLLGLVFGSETNGLRAVMDDLPAHPRATTIRIPMHSTDFRCFNLANSAAMVMWEVQRQFLQSG